MTETNPTTHSTVVGYFPSEQNAEDALRALHAAGFNPEQIGVAGRAASEAELKENRPGFWQRIRNQFRGNATERNATQLSPELSGSENPNFYNYEASDFRGSLGALSIPEEHSRYFSELLAREGEGVLITVDAGSRRSDAEVILKTNGADLGQEMSAWSPRETSGRAPGDQRIELYGEVLRVHRDRVQRGEVRLRKEIITETRSLNVPVTREELVLERTPVEGERTAPGAEIGKESEIRIPLSEERVSVEKEPVVREEVRAGKREVTDVESHDAQVRHEELKVEGEKESEEERRRRAA